MGESSQAKLLLMKQLKDLSKNPVEGFSAGLKNDDNVFLWEIMIMGPPETPYEGGYFTASMTFPFEYPNHPPKLKFESEFYHPNVYPDGTVCISILHNPGEDQYGYESAAERWLPIHTVESILISVLSMISSPNIESPANIDAAVCSSPSPNPSHPRHQPAMAAAAAVLASALRRPTYASLPPQASAPRGVFRLRESVNKAPHRMYICHRAPELCGVLFG